MGRGGDAGTPATRPTLRRSNSILDKLQSFQPREKLNSVKQDLTVLKNIWFTKVGLIKLHQPSALASLLSQIWCY